MSIACLMLAGGPLSQNQTISTESRREVEGTLREPGETAMRLPLTMVLLTLSACGPELDLEPENDAVSSTEERLEVTNFGSNPGALRMYATLPSRPAAAPGLVVALHGCTQTATEYKKAGWDTFAERFGFYVLYPEVTSGAKCFGWFETVNTRRGSGQAASIAQAVEWMRARYGLDASRIFVTGLSAGGGMTASLLASYPDVFSAGATMAGLPAQCASSIGGSSSCQQGLDKTPQQWGDLVRAAAPSGTSRWPRVAIWNGDADYTVNVKNLNELMEQWTQVNGLDTSVDATSTVGRATRREYRNAAGRTLVETWTVSSMGHGTAVAPAAGCGNTGAFVLDVGLCSTEWSVRFFGLDDGGLPPPVVDAGTPVVDAGTPVVDAGTPVVDAGTPVVDAGTPVVDAGTPVVDAGTPSGSCVEFNDSNYNQVQAGRAVRCGQYNSYTCAKGSGENVGLWNTFYKSWLSSSDGVYWSAARCP
jgi:poly(hydroxyalkanoate) depolymerase family esterase